MPLTFVQCPSCKGSVAVEEKNVFCSRSGQPPEFDLTCVCGQQISGFLQARVEAGAPLRAQF